MKESNQSSGAASQIQLLVPQVVPFENSDHPLRAEILSREALIQLALHLADGHTVSFYQRRAAQLFPRFEENTRILERAYFTLAQAAKAGQALTPGGEWFLDNYHVVEQHSREIRDLLPKRYYRTLPALTSGTAEEGRGKPRVYALAVAIISHTDAVVDAELLTAFIAAYQTKQVLSIGELWAIPIMLRLALLENLRRLATVTLAAREAEQRTAAMIERILGGEVRIGTQILLDLAEALRQDGDLSSSAVSFLVRQLRAYGPQAALALKWLEEFLNERGSQVDDLLRDEWFGKAANQISIGNCFTSLKTILSLDWLAWFESTSAVDAVLRRDPAETYSRCDFATRDRYRSRIEQLARLLRRSEVEIAEELIALTEQQARLGQVGIGGKLAHVGYYLIGKGAFQFDERLGVGSRGLFFRVVDNTLQCFRHSALAHLCASFFLLLSSFRLPYSDESLLTEIISLAYLRGSGRIH